jgi:flavin-binding protein dodecin
MVGSIGPVRIRVRVSVGGWTADGSGGGGMGAIIAENPLATGRHAQLGRIPAICQRRWKERTIRLLRSNVLQPAIFRENTLSSHVYKHIELTGSSTKNIEDAVSTAIAKASLSVRNIHWFEVVETRGHVEKGKVAHWQVTIKVGFTLED